MSQNKLIYSEVDIEGQVWSAEDLQVTIYQNGDPICEALTDEEWIYLSHCEIGAYYWYEIKNSIRFLYNGYAVNDLRGLAPDGWLIPTLNNWETLIMNLGGYEVAGGKLKDSGFNNWISPNTGATNSSGFKAFGSGCKEIICGGNYLKRMVAGYWTKTPSKKMNLFENHVFLLRYDSSSVFKLEGYVESGESVRCIKK